MRAKLHHAVVNIADEFGMGIDMFFFLRGESGGAGSEESIGVEMFSGVWCTGKIYSSRTIQQDVFISLAR